MKQVYFIENLDCANCAAKVEKKLRELEQVEQCELNFVNQTITIVSPTYLEPNFLEYYARKVEADVTIKAKRVEKKGHQYFDLIRLAISAVLLIFGIVLEDYFYVAMPLSLLSYVIAGYPVIISALKNIVRGKIFDENFLMLIASVGAIGIQLYVEAVAVMLLYSLGEYFQELSVSKSRDKITDLVKLQEKTAFKKTEAGLEEMPLEMIQIGDTITVKPGGRVPLDGVLRSAQGHFDRKSITGEASIIQLQEKEDVLSGFICVDYPVEIMVTKHQEDSTLSKILALVEEATNTKTKTEKFITKFAKYYTPIVTLTALFVAFVVPAWNGYRDLAEWVHTAIIFLVVSCPCALVISIPLAYFASIGSLSKQGVLVKGNNYLDALTKIDLVIFDKTGTLTTGDFKISEIHTELDQQEFLKITASLEAQSTHPIAQFIQHQYSGPLYPVSEVEEVKGHGMVGTIQGKVIKIGNTRLVPNEISRKKDEMTLFVSQNDVLIGYFVFRDQVKAEAASAILALQRQGLEVVMLTGDKKEVADAVAKELQIDRVHAELLPHEKYEYTQTYKDQNQKFIYCGDGINDTPALAMADVGISFGIQGSDVAVEQADIVIVDDDLTKIPYTIKLARRTRVIVMINIIMALVIKFGEMGITLAGYKNIWLALFADVGVSILAILNSMRLLRKMKNKTRDLYV